MLTEPIVQVSVHVTPGTHITTDDRPHPDGPYRVAILYLGHVAIHVGLNGDPGIVATTGALIDALTVLRANARQRIADAHTGLPAPEDGLDAASMAEAVAGWTEADKAAAWGR